LIKGTGIAAAAVAAALLLPASAVAQAEVDAIGTIWDPDEVQIALGDEVTWNFDAPGNTMSHDVWLVPPGGDPDPAGDDIFEVTSGPVPAGGPPVSYTFGQVGSWQYICRLHSGYSGGAWTGMVGTAEVSETGPSETELELTARPKVKRVSPGRSAALTAAVENVGGAEATNVRVCAKAPKRLVSIKGKSCRGVGSLDAGGASAPRFSVKPTRRAKGKRVKVSFAVSAANAERETAAATLKVKRR
jgi:plastocyanin